MERVVYTIGHSNQAAERLLELLRQHEITAVADVRSQPYSRFSPQFNREEISAFLKHSGVEYVFLGQELGARPEDPSCYRNGRAQYSLIAKSSFFRKGIERLLAGTGKFRIAIMCAEKDPLACHRTILISRHLHEHGIDVRHILEDSRVESHADLLLRLLRIHGIQENHLFYTTDELLAVAYDKQAEAIQYAADEEHQQPSAASA
jgi:uncharacterized protein (DUF488 family)